MPHVNMKKPTAIAELVTAMMTHYWTSEELTAQRERQVTDWIADLIEYPLGLIEDACATWRRTRDKRPTPADIRRLCNEQSALPPLIREDDWDEVEIMRRADEWARDAGFADMGDYQAQGHTAAMWLPNGKRRRFYAGEGHADYDRNSGAPPTPFSFAAQELAERAEYAAHKGYDSWDDYLIAIEEGRDSIRGFFDWWSAQQPPHPPVRGFKSARELAGMP